MEIVEKKTFTNFLKFIHFNIMKQFIQKLKGIFAHCLIISIAILLALQISCRCKPTPEEDATESIKTDFLKEHGDKAPTEQFVLLLDKVENNTNTVDHQKTYFELLTELVDNSEQCDQLDKDPTSDKNPLYLVLQAISKFSQDEGLLVASDSKEEKYFSFFELLQKKGFVIDSQRLENIKQDVIKNKKEHLYYPLVSLKIIDDAAQQVHYQSKDIPILMWCLAEKKLNRNVQLKMLQALVNTNIKNINSAINQTTHLPNIGELTPPMYAATQAQGARQAEQEQIIEMMKLFLNIPTIQLLDIIKSDHIQAPKKVNEQPLLSFIIYNALDKKINNRDEWLKLLQLALNTGELKKKNKNNKNAVEKYLKEYVQHNDQHNPNENFSNNNLYDNTRLQAVEKLLTDYYTST